MKSRYVILSIRLFTISAVLIGIFAVVTYLNSPVPKVDINASGTYIRGCPEWDCFPSVDRPRFLSVSEAEGVWADNEDVIGLSYGGVTKAYPLKIVDYHHIVNDWFGDEPIAVTRCALCDTSVAYKREVKGSETEFGVVGTLLDSCLVMYDRATNTSWVQMSGDAIEGELVGENIESIEVEHTTWGEWKALYPDSLILSRNTGFFKAYETNVMEVSGYTTSEEIHYPIRSLDTRLHPKEIVFGVLVDGESRAYTKWAVSRADVINDRLGGEDLVVLYDLESDLVRFFSRNLGGRVLSFEKRADGFFDKETGSRWNFEGVAVSGEYQGRSLDRVYALESYWFSWAVYHPETDLFLVE